MKLLQSLGLPGTYDMWNTTVLQTLLILIFSPIAVIVMWTPVPMISFTYVVTFAWANLCLGVLWMTRKSRPPRLATGIYFANVVICGLGVNFNQEFWFQTSTPFQAFFGYKFIASVLAMQAPTNRTIGRASLTFLFFAPLIQYFYWNSNQRALIGTQEPWLTTLTVACAAVLYEQSLQFHQMLEKKARLETAAKEMRRYAHLLLGAQHLINTPLQIIEGTSELIRYNHPEAGNLVDRIDKAFEPIKEVNRLLSFGRNHVDWVEVQLPSTVADLEKEIYSLVPEVESLPSQARAD